MFIARLPSAILQTTLQGARKRAIRMPGEVL